MVRFLSFRLRFNRSISLVKRATLFSKSFLVRLTSYNSRSELANFPLNSSVYFLLISSNSLRRLDSSSECCNW